MTNARIFLDLYNTLEELLKAKYTTPDRHFSNVVLRFANENEGRKWREELDLCREIRNMLSHHSRFEGEDIFQPSDAIIRLLREIVDAVEHPPVAMSLCTPRKSLLTCSLNDSVSKVVRRMSEAGYSHVPVLSGKTLAGVFSADAVFSRLEKYGEAAVTDETPLSRFSEFLPVTAHKSETYRFVDAKASFSDIQELFTPTGPKKLRVSAVFVTTNGKSTGELLGMITPWDMIKEYAEER